MDPQLLDRLATLADLDPEARLDAVAPHADALWSAAQDGTLDTSQVAALTAALAGLMDTDVGQPRPRLAAGVLLGRLGDPRLHTPADSDYWATITLKSGDAVALGRFPVTNAEFQAWVDAGGYDDASAWTEVGWAWLQGCDNPWPTLAKSADTDDFTVPNQPVVGVSLHEAMAYATAHDSRLPRWYERVMAVRGPEKRPYPWGSPFGEGNANTKEEVLGRPCAVGMYVRDATPEGIRDLAGNVAEWTAEQVGEEWLIHPGSWEAPSLSSWAKALTSTGPTSRWSALGFRIARDA